MYELFTDRARRVIQLANQEAQRFNHEYIDTEHILLGLIMEGSGFTANVLKDLKVDLHRICWEVEELMQIGPDKITMGKLPLTTRTKKVIEYSMEEARNLGHSYVDTEHILMGLLHERMGVAAQVLKNLGLKLEMVQEEAVRPNPLEGIISDLLVKYGSRMLLETVGKAIQNVGSVGNEIYVGRAIEALAEVEW